MSTLPEQLSAAGKSQVEAQLDFFQALAARAVENAGRIVALNLSTGRASVEQSSAAMHQLIGARDPRDLLALGAQGRHQFEGMLAYGRALFGIIVSPAAPSLAAAPAAPSLAAAPAAPAKQAAAAPAPAPEAAPAPKPQAAPMTKPTPIAKAAEKAIARDAASRPAAAPFPAAGSPVVVTSLKAVEAAPAPAPVSGTPKAGPKRTGTASKAGRKK